MEKKEFTIVPKLLGLIVKNENGEVAGVIDASSLLTEDSRQALNEAMTEILAQRQLEGEKQRLERMFLLPARDVEQEREGGSAN